MADAQKAESTPSPDTEGVRLADELTSAIRIGVEDDVTIPFDLSVRIHAFLRTAQNTGRDEVLEEAVAKYRGAELSCPANKRALGDKACPRCSALSNEPCRETVRAAYAVADAAKAAFKSSPPVSTVDEEGGGQ